MKLDYRKSKNIEDRRDTGPIDAVEAKTRQDYKKKVQDLESKYNTEILTGEEGMAAVRSGMKDADKVIAKEHNKKTKQEEFTRNSQLASLPAKKLKKVNSDWDAAIKQIKKDASFLEPKSIPVPTSRPDISEAKEKLKKKKKK